MAAGRKLKQWFVWAVVGVLCAAALLFSYRIGRPHRLELPAIAATIAGLLAVKSSRRAIAAAPLAHRFAAAALFICFLSGHLASRSTRTFPFVTWRMFPGMNVVPDPRYYVIEGVESSGERIRISPERVWFPLRDFRFTGSYQLIADRRADLDGLHRELVLALARAYMRRHPEHHLRRLEVLEQTVPLHEYTLPANVKREFIYSVNIPER